RGGAELLEAVEMSLDLGGDIGRLGGACPRQGLRADREALLEVAVEHVCRGEGVEHLGVLLVGQLAGALEQRDRLLDVVRRAVRSILPTCAYADARLACSARHSGRSARACW